MLALWSPVKLIKFLKMLATIVWCVRFSVAQIARGCTWAVPFWSINLDFMWIMHFINCNEKLHRNQPSKFMLKDTLGLANSTLQKSTSQSPTRGTASGIDCRHNRANMWSHLEQPLRKVNFWNNLKVMQMHQLNNSPVRMGFSNSWRP